MIFFCRGTCYYYIQAVSFDGGNLSSSYSCAFLRDLSHSLSLLTYSSVLLWAAWVLVVVSLCNVSWLPVDDVSIRWRRNRSTDNRHSAYRPHSSAAILPLIILKAFISFRKHPFQNDGTVMSAQLMPVWNATAIGKFNLFPFFSNFCTLFERKIWKIIHRIGRIFFFYIIKIGEQMRSNLSVVLYIPPEEEDEEKKRVCVIVSNEDDGYSHFNGNSSTEEKVNGFLFFFFLWAFACCANVELCVCMC